MSSVSTSALGHNVLLSSSKVGWDDLPTEIFLYIFKKMDITSLRCCFYVSRKWREIATCVCELQDLWQALAEDGMVNHGVTQHHKSVLSWKDLYFNSFLWKHLPSAAACRIEQLVKKNIHNLHVYNDKLIVVDPCGFEYYDVETLQSIRFVSKELCVDVQESDDVLMVVTNSEVTVYNTVTVFIKLNKDEEIDLHSFLNGATHAFAESRHWRLVGNRVYIIDSRFCLWECVAMNESLTVRALARFYGNNRFSRGNSLNSIHVIQEDVFVSVEWDGLLICAKNSRGFRKVNALEIPTKVIEGSNFSANRIPTSLDHMTIRHGERFQRLHKFNALIKYPLNVKFLHECEAPENMIHYHYDDPEMTAGLQHGDVVFRGFEDGGIEINLLRDDFKYDLKVQQLDRGDVTDPAVVALEVCELKDMHKVFVATSSKLYTILLKYPQRELET